MEIRKFTPNDLKRVFEIENMSFKQSYGINMFQQLYDMGVGFLVAEDNGYVIGYIIFWIKYQNQGHIISIAVDKNYRRLGAGTKLLIKAISVLSLLDIDAIYLEVNENNLFTTLASKYKQIQKLMKIILVLLNFIKILIFRLIV